MKLSILIPTRNRLELLKYAIASVIKQSYTNWEVIISDNASEEDIGGYIQSLNDPRFKYSRSETFLSVTESWNRCTNLSSGDFLVMIGDDDLFLKNHFQIIVNLIEKYQSPDLIYTNAFLYAYPNVLESCPNGTFQPFGSLYAMPKSEVPFWLDHKTKISILDAILRFNAIYSTNMQHAVISRSLLEKVKRNNLLFYSPYPDIYAMSALFLEATRLLIYPKELVVIGISPKSYGYFAANNKDKEGSAFLNTEHEMNKTSLLQSVFLPGNYVYTCWLAALEYLKLHFGIEKYGLHPDYESYKRIQIDYAVSTYLNGKSNIKKLLPFLNAKEKLLLLNKLGVQVLKASYKKRENRLPLFFQKWIRSVLKLLRPSQPLPPALQSDYPPAHIIPTTQPNRFANILEIYEQVEPVDCSVSSSVSID